VPRRGLDVGDSHKIITMDIVFSGIVSLKSIMMNAATPDGAPPWRIRNIKNSKPPAPPCLGEALRRVTLINTKMRVYLDQTPFSNDP